MRCCWRPRNRVATLLCAGAAALLLAFLSQAEAGPPNVVVIVSDDQGSDDYGFRGHPHIRTPHLDRLAAESLTCDRGWVPTPFFVWYAPFMPHDPHTPPVAARFAPKSKTSSYGFGHRTPIMVRWPGRVKPERSKDLASSIDIVPTVLDADGVERPARVPGINLLDATTRQQRRHVFGECYTIRSQSLDDPAKSLRRS
ncbi:hypothetical protein EBR04_00810 [bacterium]|nr:hypothetical protein [bacterium]